MTPEQITAYIQVGSILVHVGGVAVDQLAAMFGAGPALSEDDLNTILRGVRAEAERRKALAEADAGGDGHRPRP